MKRIAVVDNSKFRNMEEKRIAHDKCNRAGIACAYFEGDQLRIDENTCTGPLATICSKAAPQAIKIIELPEELTKTPIHRYGKNGFALYSLPSPVFGKVVGIIGVNGIGKSTAIKILSGEIKPNLGEPGKESDINDVINYFKGTEAQFFFEQVKGKKIIAAYKPQAVDTISKNFKGNALAFLKKADEKNMLNEIIEKLGLIEVIDNDVETLSGGELQKVAIAATMLRDANLYIFDEPTSYLDIKERLKISNIIKGLADEKTAVIVVEHDLIALDYMADYINIMYGEAGVYGIVSSAKAASNGINAYLEGYIREENIRFRDHKIKFDVGPPEKAKKLPELTSWPSFEKKLGRFTLDATKGEVSIGERIGILGENGTGKTTFVKILSGAIKPDDAELNLKVKVSYKPQYLTTDSDEIVMNILRDAIRKYETEIIRPLAIKQLFMEKINELSGGELQRVAIALCLSRDADLYLLDEPSAYLDVEERLVVSKVIASLMEEKRASCLVVDHDLLFLDYLSERLIVFTGEPSIYGKEEGPMPMEEGMNKLLSGLGITLRREMDSKRPRINKIGSVKDREQKASGKYFYQ